MQTAANISFVLTDSSSFKRLADFEIGTSFGTFYQLIASCLVEDVHNKQVFRGLGDRLVVLAEQAHGLRQMDVLERLSQMLAGLPLPRQYEVVGRYYQGLCVQRLGLGDAERAAGLLERVAESAPPLYRIRAMISLAANSRNQGDNQSALSLYCEAARFASISDLCDPYATITAQRMVAVISSEEGNQRGALALLENLFPIASSMRSLQPHVYYDYMNSFAVELCEVGRLEEARNVSQIVLASPFAAAYPEWRETRDEIELRGWRASRSVVAVTQRIGEPGNEGNQGKVAAEPSAAAAQETPEARNVITLPTARPDFRTAALAAETQSPARVIEFPSRTTMTEQNDKDELGLSEKRRIVADELYEMFMAALEDAPVDGELVEELYRVFLKKRKKG
jgi:hypothetical protein